MTCLLIDDDVDDQEVFALAVGESRSKLGVNIGLQTARDGLNGLEILAKNAASLPDFIFVDMNMPLMNGVEVIEEIRKLESAQKSKLFLYSTSADKPGLKQQVEALGADVVVKPASIDALVKILTVIFSG